MACGSTEGCDRRGGDRGPVGAPRLRSCRLRGRALRAPASLGRRRGGDRRLAGRSQGPGVARARRAARQRSGIDRTPWCSATRRIGCSRSFRLREIWERTALRAMSSAGRTFRSILLEAVGAGRVQTGARCVGLDQDDGGVVVRLEEGWEAKGDIAVGADGIHSAVRNAVAPGGEPSYAGIAELGRDRPERRASPGERRDGIPG